MKPLLYILTILFFGMTSCQNIPSLVDSIAKENTIECEAVGLTGRKSNIYKNFEKLKRSASKKKLIQLINHDSLSVVGYSSYALIDKKLVNPSELLTKFINKKESVSTFCGCLMDRKSISSLIYHRYWNTRIEYPNEEDFDNFIINDSKELKKMDSIILFSKEPDRILLIRALENRVYPKKYKSKIEDWAFNNGNFFALKYVLTNLYDGNQKRIEFSLIKYLEKEDVYEGRKEEIKQMLKDIKNKV